MSNKFIPKFLYRTKFVWYTRGSIEIDATNIPRLLKMREIEFRRELERLVGLEPYHHIISVKMRHTIGGTGDRLKLVFNNNPDLDTSIMHTYYEKELSTVMPPKLKEGIVSVRSFVDMNGLERIYMVEKPFKIITYLKLMNFFKSCILECGTTITIPIQQLSEEQFLEHYHQGQSNASPDRYSN